MAYNFLTGLDDSLLSDAIDATPGQIPDNAPDILKAYNALSTPEVMAKAKENYANKMSNINIGQAFSNLGDVIAGQKVGSTLPYFQSVQGDIAKETLNEQNQRKQLLDAYLKSKYAENLGKSLENKISTQGVAQQNKEKEIAIKEKLAAAQEAALAAKVAKEEKTTASGKQLPAAQAISFGEANASFDALQAANNEYLKNQDLTGPIQGKISQGKALLEVGEAGKRAKSFDAQLKLNAQTIGKYLEGGKLTDADIDRYKSMLPSLYDSPEVANKKTILLQNLIAKKQKAEKEVLAQTGFNVEGIKTKNPLIEKSIVKKLINNKTGQTKVIYSDGSEEVLNGK